MVSDTFSFVKELINSNFLSDNPIMASFDTRCLFTNMSLDKTVDIITNRLLRNATHFHNFYRDQFTKLLRYAVKIATLFLMDLFSNNFCCFHGFTPWLLFG